MSRITWTVEQRTHDDPWTQQQETYTVRVAWACECGAVSPKRLREDTTLEMYAAHHLAQHGAPTPRDEPDGPCACLWVYVPVAHEQHGGARRRHAVHHEHWLLEVWDA